MSDHESEAGRAQAPAGWRFADCELDLRLRELRRDGEAVAVEPRVLDLLAFLIERRDQAVSKDDLLAAVWPGQVVSDAVFSQAIMKARKAVGDDGQRQALIRTVHGYGYRFVVSVESLPEQGESDSKALPPPPTSNKSTWWRWPTVLLAVVAALLLYWLWQPVWSTAATRYAVLPVVNGTGDPSLDWTRMGLAVLVSERLAGLSGQSLMSTSEVAQRLRGAGLDDQQLDLDDPGLRQVLPRGEAIQLRLEHEAGLYRLHASVQRPTLRPLRLSVLGESVAELGEQIALQLVRMQAPRWNGLIIEAEPVRQGFAVEALARGLNEYHGGDPERARSLFAAALTADSPDPVALYHLAILAIRSADHGQAQAYLDELATQAEERDDDGLRLHTLYALARMAWSLGNHEQALALLDEAEERQLRSGKEQWLVGSLAQMRGIVLRALGQIDAAREATQRALTISVRHDSKPGQAAAYNGLGVAAWLDGDVRESEQMHRRALALRRELGTRSSEAASLNNIGHTLLTQARWAEAEQFLNEAQVLREEFAEYSGQITTLSNLMRLHADRGEHEQAQERLQQVRELAERIDTRPVRLAALAAAVELAWIEGDQATAWRHWHTWNVQRGDQVLDSLDAWHIRLLLRDDEPDRAEEILTAMRTRERVDAGGAWRNELDILVADLAFARGDDENAAAGYRSAAEFARRGGNTRAELDALVKLSQVQLRSNDLDAAVQSLQRLDLLDLAQHEALRARARIRVALRDGESCRLHQRALVLASSVQRASMQGREAEYCYTE